MQLFRTIAVVLALSAGLGIATARASSIEQAHAPKRAPQTETVYTTKTGKKYHQTGCRSLAKSKLALSLAEAKKRGLTACAICFRTKG